MPRIPFWIPLLALSACSQPPEAAPPTQPAGPAPAADDPAFHAVGTRPTAVAVAELNGDGHLDVAVANTGAGTVTVLLGDGRRGLRAAATYPAGREPSDVDAVDLDRDGDADLVLANHETSGVTVLRNDGTGRFSPAPGSPFDTGARPHHHGLATGDFDGDGWPDVAVESSDTREVRVLRGGASGLSPAAGIAVGTMPYYRLGSGDANGDGRPEVLVPGHGDNTARGVERGSDGRLRLAAWTVRLSAQPWAVVGGDVNGDRRDDMVVVETDGVSLWLAGPSGFSAAPGSRFPVRGATEAAVGDLDGDRVAEVAVGPWDGELVTVLGGAGAAPRTVRVCERPIGLAIADLDGDGRGELLAACATTDRLAVATGAPAR